METGAHRVFGFLKNPFLDLDQLGETVDVPPKRVSIVPTSRCNTRCIYCRHYYKRFGEDMPEEVYDRIARAIYPGAETVDLTGDGEAFLSPLFDRMMSDCARHRARISLVTNGIALARDDGLISRLVAGGVSLSLSMDGASAEIFGFSRPLIKWETMVEVLERIKMAANKADRNGKFELTILAVMMKANIAGLPDLVRLAAESGARNLGLLPLTREELGENLRDQSLRDSPELVPPPLLKAMSLAARLGVRLVVPPSFRQTLLSDPKRFHSLRGQMIRGLRFLRLGWISLRRSGIRHVLRRSLHGFGPRAKAGITHCLAPWNEAFFRENGDVFPCCIMYRSMDNIRTREWGEIWNGPSFRHLRRTIHGWNPTASCRFCSFPSGINGGDETQYEKFFARYTRLSVPLDSPQVKLGEGCHEIERLSDGSPSHFWMGGKAAFTLAMTNNARFLRLRVIPGVPVADPVLGRARVNGGNWEHFDNSCEDVTFPIASVSSGRVLIEIEMEKTYRAGEDPRSLGLAIRGILFLCEG